MKRKIIKKKAVLIDAPGLDQLLGQLRRLIQQSRQQALRAVDVIQVRTCWRWVGILWSLEQGGSERARYGANLFVRLA